MMRNHGITLNLVVALVIVITCSKGVSAGSLRLPDISAEQFRKYLASPKPVLGAKSIEALATREPAAYPREAPFPESVLNEQGLWEMRVPIGRNEGRRLHMMFVLVRAGRFFMGSPDGSNKRIDLEGRILRDDRRFEKGREEDEGPVHEVMLPGFWIGKYEVTNEQYLLFQPKHRSGSFLEYTLNREEQPVVRVSWDEARAYAAWLTRNDGRGLRFGLPTEAEWEYACRAGTQGARFWQEESGAPCEYANLHDLTPRRDDRLAWLHQACEDRYAVASPVGRLAANGFGLHDLLGNVSEWCADWYDRRFYRMKTARGRNPLCTNHLSRCRVLRGGAWSLGPRFVRSAKRERYGPQSRFNYVGFRLVFVPSEEGHKAKITFSHRRTQTDTDISFGRHGRTKESSLREKPFM
jgi:sulfatase modifying factor 1